MSKKKQKSIDNEKKTCYFGSVLKDTTKKRGENMDRLLLEYEMKKRGVTVEKLCLDLKMSRSAFYRKCNGTSEFTQSEIQNIVEYLGLNSPMGIFFKEKVS